MRRHQQAYTARVASESLLESSDTKATITTPAIDPHRLQLALKSLSRGCLPAGCAVAAGMLETFSTTVLFQTELPAIDGAQPRRRAAFRGGRACARAALGELGVQPVAIPAGAAGAPCWPDGFVGSISHTDEVAAAVVARSPPVYGIGLDIEGDGQLDDATMVRIVCRPEELVPGCNPSHTGNLRHGKLLFVLKEAVYKLYWPLTGTFLDFHDLRVTLEEAAGTFRAELVDPQLPAVAGTRAITGRFARAEGFVIALTARVDAG